ncbi:hypothetical protein [Halomicrobium salinisoli]|uniref:hypothetical protein n=1 Tax=Halomicrobium salinisoli TaxID=2878391 RepID=UPI001CF09970|nr:hypothetical protein [Halomicrobium salinisoli]
MDRREAIEAGGAALACMVAGAGTFYAVAGAVDWVLVLGIGMCAAIAAAANYRARVGHAEQVADEAPGATIED